MCIPYSSGNLPGYAEGAVPVSSDMGLLDLWQAHLGIGGGWEIT